MENIASIYKGRKNDSKPEVWRIEELVTKVKYGEIKLPKFQRPFVWIRRIY